MDALAVQMGMTGSEAAHPLPRELVPGVFWFGRCLVVNDASHVYHSSYLVVGTEHSAFIETGSTWDVDTILAQFSTVADSVPLPRYVFPTHSEMAHAGGVGALLERYPEATAHGDVSDLHLVFPEFEDRMHYANPGDRFDLGDTEIVVVESVFRDLVTSRWYFDTRRRILFTGDGFAYSHHHDAGACGRCAEEAPALDIGLGMARFAQAAFHWTRFVDIEPYVQRLGQLVFEELDAQLIAPTHGVPILNPRATMPAVEAGFRAMAMR